MGIPTPVRADLKQGGLAASTRFLLLLWPLIAVPASLLLVLWDGFANTVVWPAPLEPIPRVHAGFAAAFGLGTGLASLAALQAGRWDAARPLMVFYLGYAVVAEISAIRQLLAGAIPLQIWLYIALGLVFIALSGLALQRQR